MNLSESLALLKSRLDNIDQEVVVTEGKGHLDHPEDLVFLEDESGVRRAIDAMVATVNNPNTVTIKWD